MNHADRELSSLPLGQRVEFPTVAAVVKFFGSRPAKMN